MWRFQNYRDCGYTCNPHKFEIPALRFPRKVTVNPCKHLQCNIPKVAKVSSLQCLVLLHYWLCFVYWTKKLTLVRKILFNTFFLKLWFRSPSNSQWIKFIFPTNDLRCNFMSLGLNHLLALLFCLISIFNICLSYCIFYD